MPYNTIIIQTLLSRLNTKKPELRGETKRLRNLEIGTYSVVNRYLSTDIQSTFEQNLCSEYVAVTAETRTTEIYSGNRWSFTLVFSSETELIAAIAATWAVNKSNAVVLENYVVVFKSRHDYLPWLLTYCSQIV